MASSGVFELTAGTTLHAADVVPFVDTTNTTQAPQGSLLKITITNFFATVPVPVTVTSTTGPQLSLRYDVSNKLTVSVASNGAVTFDAVGAGSAFTFSDAVAATISTASQPNITTMANLVTVGALNAGSITSGFGSINIGADAITAGAASFTTGAFSGNLTVGSSAFVVTAATGGFVTTGSGIFKGQVPAHQTSAITVAQDSAAESQIRCYGADGATAGTLSIHLMANDGSPDINALAFTASGWPTFTMNDNSATYTIKATNNTTAYLDLQANASTLYARLRWSSAQTSLRTMTALPLVLGTNDTDNLTIASGGAITMSSSLAITGALTGVTTLAASDKVTISKNSDEMLLINGRTTGLQYLRLTNTGADLLVGINNSTGSALTGGTAYSSFISTNNSTGLDFGIAGVVKFAIASTGSATFAGSIRCDTGIGCGAAPTSTANLYIGASTTSYAQIQLASGVAPSSAYGDGQIWFDGTHLYCRIGGVNKQLDN